MTKNPRACIVVGDYHKPGQTFVNRHIQHLFGGNTCVVSNGANGQNPYSKNVYVNRDIAKPVIDVLTLPVMKPLMRIRHGTSRVPWGYKRRALIEFLRDQQVEIILAEFGTEALTIIDVATEMNLPMFTYFRGTDASFALSKPSRVRGYSQMFPRLSGVFSVSQFLLDNLAAKGLRHDNAHVIPSGVDVRRFTPRPKHPRSFLAVGRMIEKKAPQISLQSFAEATRDHDDAHLRFIGDGPERAPCEALAAKLGVSHKVSFDGEQPHDVVRGHLETAEVFLQHSVPSSNGTTEGLPTAIQEALACGCAVISTRHAGIPEAIDEGLNGWLCDEYDADSYTQLIRDSLTADMASMTAMARKTAEERFDNAVLLKKTEAVLEQALQ